MLMPSVRMLPVVAASTICAATLLAHAAAQCPFVPKNFVCSKDNYRNFDSNCACFVCYEENDVGKYVCGDIKGGVQCMGDYTKDTTLPWSTGSYIVISSVFVAVSIILLVALRLLARRLRTDKADTDKSEIDGQPSRGCGKRAYHKVYHLLFGSMFKNSGKERRSCCDFWIAHCELLDCFWCCGNRKARNEDWRPFYLRFMRLLATLSVGAALGMMFGSLDFDSVTCTTTGSRLYCKMGSIEYDEDDVSTDCDDASGIMYTSPKVLTSTAVATGATQLVKFVGSYAQDVGKPGTKLDIVAHVVWFLAALLALPICYGISSHLMRSTDNDLKKEASRMQTVIFVIAVTWGQNQILDLVKMPFAFLTNRMFMLCFPKPSLDDKNQSVQPTPRELAQPKYAPGPEETNNEDKVDGEDKVDAIASPTIAQ